MTHPPARRSGACSSATHISITSALRWDRRDTSVLPSQHTSTVGLRSVSPCGGCAEWENCPMKASQFLTLSAGISQMMRPFLYSALRVQPVESGSTGCRRRQPNTSGSGSALTVAHPSTQRLSQHSERRFCLCSPSAIVPGSTLHLNFRREWWYIYGLGDRHRRREKVVWEMSANMSSWSSHATSN